jgi:hypothetical protein
MKQIIEMLREAEVALAQGSRRLSFSAPWVLPSRLSTAGAGSRAV